MRGAARSSRPDGESKRRPGCPGLYEEGTRISSRERARLCSGAPTRELLRPCKWNAVAKAFAVQIAARWPPVRQRTMRPTQPYRLVPVCSGVKTLARVRGSTARRVCPRVEFGCRSRRTTSSSEKRAPGGKGVRGRGPSSSISLLFEASAPRSGEAEGCKDVDNRYRGGKAMAPG